MWEKEVKYGAGQGMEGRRFEANVLQVVVRVLVVQSVWAIDLWHGVWQWKLESILE